MSPAKGNAPAGGTAEASGVSEPSEQGTNVSNSTQVTPSTATRPVLTVIEGKVTATSQQVAEHFHKRHKNVLRAIENILPTVPEDYRLNFELTSRDVAGPKGGTRQEPAYRLTRDGFTLLAMGFTGAQAMNWKVRYIQTFNEMEAALLQEAGAPQIGERRINPAEAQALRELVQGIVLTGKQSYGETYERLHRKFRVNSYLQLPAAKFDEAVEYLKAKAPVPEMLDAERVRYAMNMANQTAAGVQSAAFTALLAQDHDFAYDRWLMSFTPDANGKLIPTIRVVDRRSMVVTMEELPKRITDRAGFYSDEMLLEIAAACISRVNDRAGRRNIKRA